MYIAWYLLLVSTAAGIWVLMAVTGSLGAKDGVINHSTVYQSNIVVPSIIQVVSFGIGPLLAVIFGVRN